MSVVVVVSFALLLLLLFIVAKLGMNEPPLLFAATAAIFGIPGRPPPKFMAVNIGFAAMSACSCDNGFGTSCCIARCARSGFAVVSLLFPFLLFCRCCCCCCNKCCICIS